VGWIELSQDRLNHGIYKHMNEFLFHVILIILQALTTCVLSRRHFRIYLASWLASCVGVIRTDLVGRSLLIQVIHLICTVYLFGVVDWSNLFS
jgi:hypothetical protein